MVEYEEIHPNAIEYTDYQEHYVSLRGIKFYFECENCDSPSKVNAIPILFVHGWSANRFRLHPLYMAFVEKKYPVFRLDLRGHGWSQKKGIKDYRLNTMKEDLNQFIHEVMLKQYGFHKVIIAAHSMGGSISQLLAIDQPEYLSHLILIASSAQWASTLKDQLRWWIYTNMYRMNYNKIYAKKKEGHKHYGLEHFPMWADNYQVPERQLYTARRATIQGIRQMRRMNIVPLLFKIKVPTLILAGENDIDAIPKFSRIIDANILNSQLEIIPDTNHDLSIGKPLTMRKIIESFINES